jgi:dTDP-4-dehydrorhamnose 3,5-epimerase
MAPKRTLIIGARGQLGRAVADAMPDAVAIGRDVLDLADPAAVAAFDFSPYESVINAAAYTKVDQAETPAGRREAWAVNVVAVAALVAAAREHRFLLVHVSSDYVFDGTIESHDEDEPFSPLCVYGQTKAAGDALVDGLARHYLLRTSWVIGDGANFVRTMAGLADRGVEPGVVNDQHGRLTFTNELARGIVHLLATRPAYGTYNLTNGGPSMTWAEIARHVFTARGRTADAVRDISTEEFSTGKQLAPRPRHSLLNLDKITATGFQVGDAMVDLKAYLSGAG